MRQASGLFLAKARIDDTGTPCLTLFYVNAWFRRTLNQNILRGPLAIKGYLYSDILSFTALVIEKSIPAFCIILYTCFFLKYSK